MIDRLLASVRSFLRPPPPVGDPSARQRWRNGALVGVAPALILQTWMLTAGTWNLVRWDRTSDFYDAQAHAILRGTFTLDYRILGLEAFTRGQNSYMYFGPVPAVLRLPVAAFTYRLDGRLGTLSMLTALGVLVVVLLGLGWRLRHLILGDIEVTRGEQAGIAGVMFLIVGGSSLLYASSRTWVYHEAIMWGVALTMASYAWLLLWLQYGARRFLVMASVFATLAFLSRASVGGGAVAGLTVAAGCVAAGHLAERTAGRRRASAYLRRLDWTGTDAAAPRAYGWLTAAILTPLVSYAVVNYIKFRSLFSVPFDQQSFTVIDPQRRAMLAANGGSYFNIEFLPSNLLQYWRPDMLSISGRWPLISYPRRPMVLIGDPVYDLHDLTAGIPATMPLLVGLGLVGAVAIVRARPASLRPLRVVVLACVAGTITVLNIGYIANRYQSDFLPLMIVPALVGVPLLVAWLRSRPRSLRSAVIAVSVLAGAFGTVANLALGYTFQRAYASVTPPYQIAGFLHDQVTVDGWFGDGKLPNVRQGDELPPAGSYDDIFIIGDCDAMYWSDGMQTNAVKLSNWNGVERADGQGAFEALVTFERPATDSAEPILTTSGGTGGATLVAILPASGDRVSFGYAGPDGNWIGYPVPIEFGTPTALRLVIDPRVRILELYVGGQIAIATSYTGGTEVTIGENTYDDPLLTDRFNGTITPIELDTPVCRELLPSVQP